MVPLRTLRSGLSLIPRRPIGLIGVRFFLRFNLTDFDELKYNYCMAILTIQQIKDTVSKYGEKYGIKSAYLFGSYAKNAATSDSDVDILIEKGEIKSYDDYCDLKFAIEDELNADVDLLTSESLKPRFFELIKNDRVLLYGT